MDYRAGRGTAFTVENAETGNKLAVGRTYTVKVEAKNAGAQYNGYYLTVDGVKVDGTLTAGGSTLLTPLRLPTLTGKQFIPIPPVIPRRLRAILPEAPSLISGLLRL